MNLKIAVGNPTRSAVQIISGGSSTKGTVQWTPMNTDRCNNNEKPQNLTNSRGTGFNLKGY